MPIKIKVPVKKIKKININDQILEFLAKHPNDAYTVQGIMVDNFGVKVEELAGPFRDRKYPHNTLYSGVLRTLRKLVKEGKINQAKDGKAFVFWIPQ